MQKPAASARGGGTCKECVDNKHAAARPYKVRSAPLVRTIARNAG